MNFNEHITKTLLNEYAGSEKKKTVMMDDGQKYLLKFPDPTREKDKELSYINNAISEYVACKIFESIGFSVQKTILGEYIDENGKTKIACACQDVRQNGERMYEINKLELSSLDNTHTRKLTLEYMDEVFKKMSDIIPEQELSDFYYDMFIVDALVGNTDRHNGNWAILESDYGIRISPVYDCGSSLSPLLDEKFVCEESGISCAMNALSVLVDKNGKRLKYCDFFKKYDNKNVNEALKRVMPRIDLRKIDRLILDTPYISLDRKDFYQSFVHTSYERILLPALEKTFCIPKQESEIEHSECLDFYRNVVSPLKDTATYEIQDASKFGLEGCQYSRAGKSHLFIYKNHELACVISSRSNNNDTRLNIVKFKENNIHIENVKDVENIQEQLDSEGYDIYSSQDER